MARTFAHTFYPKQNNQYYILQAAHASEGRFSCIEGKRRTHIVIPRYYIYGKRLRSQVNLRKSWVAIFDGPLFIFKIFFCRINLTV
jgi:hypothetical protein